MGNGRPPNNGMHPTADTTAVIYFHSCGAAGDAGCWALNLELKARDILRG
jgi:hypothetical protein